MSLAHQGTAGMPHWMYDLARYWVRTQLGIASAIVIGLASISLGLNPVPKSIPIELLVKSYPGPAFGLGSALVVVSAFMFVLSRQPAAQPLSGGVDEVLLAPTLPAALPGGRTPPKSDPVAPAPQARHTRSTRWVVAGMVGLLLLSLGILGAGGVLAYSSTQALLSAPAKTLTAYCADLTHADVSHYGEAYHLLSIAAQQQLAIAAQHLDDSQAYFVRLNQLHDIRDGTVQGCGLPGSRQVLVLHNTAQASLHLIRNQPYTGTVHLVFEQNSWRIDQVDPMLQGTEVAPLAAAEGFCQALVNRNYGLAYDAFSAAEQQYVGSVDAMARLLLTLGDQNYDVTLHQCATQYNSYVPPSTSGAATAVLSATLRAIPTGGEPGSCEDDTFDWTISLVRQGATWKVDNVDPATNPASTTSCSPTQA
jgi:hypothetical protein